jgi:ABC-2 type transport system permease protein
MPIFDQGYQHWDGPLSGHAWRWLAITRHGVAAQWRSPWIKAVLFFALIPALGLSAFLVLWGLLEQKSTLLTPVLFLFRGLPPEVMEGPKAYRGVFWTLAFHAFFNLELFFSMLLVLLVGPNLISQDLRFNAIPLYFSRPLRRIDYFAGKLGVIATFVALVSIVPPVLAYLIGVAFSLDVSVFRDTGHLLVASVVYGGVIVLSAGTMMLAISSLSRNSRMVGAIWIGLWIVSGVSADILTTTVRQNWCPTVSYLNDLLRIREAMIDTASARAKIRELTNVGQRQPRAGIIRRVFAKQSRPPQGFDPNSQFITPPANMPPLPPGTDAAGNSSYPWQWSAGVLAGLMGVSLWVLSSRVKSLDRLK